MIISLAVQQLNSTEREKFDLQYLQLLVILFHSTTLFLYLEHSFSLLGRVNLTSFDRLVILIIDLHIEISNCNIGD